MNSAGQYRYGLGYKPTKEDRKRMIEERKERSLARVERRGPRESKIHIVDIKESFRSAGWINADQIAAVEDEEGPQSLSFVWACSPDTQLNNWETLDLPVMLNVNKM
ncbi:hypothetical protein LR48_Vigan09g059900 [Vigna angularis]|uniref:Uncharacterized protein n=1 Tax=Phaseolus angularis TaxID=3914 RepID=A0A0L9VA61_PHAAN|nr:hypothetical protein LR48_Vigan09g059900 [Vigna angularis]